MRILKSRLTCIVCTMLYSVSLIMTFATACLPNGELPKRGVDGLYILPEASFVYNVSNSAVIIEYGTPVGYFSEELDAYEVSCLVPDRRYDCQGSASWNGKGELLSVGLSVNIDGTHIRVVFPFGFGYSSTQIVYSNPAISNCNGVEFEVLQYNDPYNDFCDLWAGGYIGTNYVYVMGGCRESKIEEYRRVFEKALKWIAIGKYIKPEFSAIHYAFLPESFRYSLSVQEAYDDASFGHLLPRQLPVAYHEKSAYRFKDYLSDYMRVEWGKWNPDYRITLTISYFEEKHEEKLVASEDAVPEIFSKVKSPIFYGKDITIELLEKSIYWRNKAINISFKYDKYKIDLHAPGLTPKEGLEFIRQIIDRQDNN